MLLCILGGIIDAYNKANYSSIKGGCMSISYKYNKDENYILVKATDRITLPEMLDFIEAVLNDQKIKAPFYEIVDFAEIRSFDFGYSGTLQFYEKLQLLVKHKNHLGTCFIANKKIALGMVNMFKIVGEEKGVNVTIFNEMNQALDFIRENHQDHSLASKAVAIN